MPFMQVEVSGPEEWIIVDGPNGGEMIPCDACGELPDYDETIAQCGEDADYDEYYRLVSFARISDYCENRECYEIEQVTGYAARLSAPGYLDCTDWGGLHDTAKAARREIIDLYGLCPACEESADGPKSGPACNFYHY